MIRNILDYSSSFFKVCFLAAAIVMQYSYPVFMLIGSLGAGRV